MKKINKIICIGLSLIMILFYEGNVYAINSDSMIDNKILSIEKQEYLQEQIQKIEEDLLKMNYSVEKSIEENIQFYQELINEEVLNHDDIQKASEIIKTLEYQLQEYRTYKVTNNSNDLRVKSSKFELSSENGLKGSSTIIGNPLQFIMNSVAAVNAWFYAKGYVLSSELLTHAVKNKNSNSYYSPINGSKVTQSPVFKKLKSKPYRSTGTDYFPNSVRHLKEICIIQFTSLDGKELLVDT